jgi:hypothetical protein
VEKLKAKNLLACQKFLFSLARSLLSEIHWKVCVFLEKSFDLWWKWISNETRERFIKWILEFYLRNIMAVVVVMVGYAESFWRVLRSQWVGNWWIDWKAKNECEKKKCSIQKWLSHKKCGQKRKKLLKHLLVFSSRDDAQKNRLRLMLVSGMSRREKREHKKHILSLSLHYHR